MGSVSHGGRVAVPGVHGHSARFEGIEIAVSAIAR